MAALAQGVLGSVRRCLTNLLKLRPPDLDPEVIEFLSELRLTPRHVHQMYRTFQQLKQHDPLTMTTGPHEASVASMARIVRSHRRWVSKIVKYLLELAGYRDTVTWDGFLYVFLQFCTLSKVELCQVMFFVVALEMKSWTVHFLTSAQLEEFFDDYSACPVKSFNTETIEFSKLPLAKYRMPDFIELAYRFSQLINPCVHLQRELQRVLPQAAFWLDYDNIKAKNRRISTDFFRHKKVMSIIDIITKKETQKRMVDGKRGGSTTPAAAAVGAPLAAGPAPLQLPPEGSEEAEGAELLEMGHLKRGFIPLPAQHPRPARQRRQAVEGLPAWMVEHLNENEDPLRGIAIGSAAEATRPPDVAPPLPEGWVSVPDPERPKRLYYWNQLTDEVSWAPPAVSGPTSVEEAEALVRQTMGPALPRVQPGKLAEGLVIKLTGRATAERGEAMARTMELDFVRLSRRGEPRRDDIVSIMERARPCELVQRPAKLVLGHR